MLLPALMGELSKLASKASGDSQLVRQGMMKIVAFETAFFGFL